MIIQWKEREEKNQKERWNDTGNKVLMLLLLSRDSVEYGQGILLLMTLTFSLRIIKQEEAEFPKFLGIQLS